METKERGNVVIASIVNILTINIVIMWKNIIKEM